MERKILVLDNHNLSPVVGEDALDFDFENNEEKSPGCVGVPFLHNLTSPLRPKDLLLIEGTILKMGLRFTVNLIYGFNDIAFHMNPRLDQNYIARNTYLNGEWGQEEGFGLMKSPLQSGKNFQIMVFVAPNAYLVCVNGYHMFSFDHRVPPHSIEKIEIFGDIDLKSATLLSTEIYPDPTIVKFKKTYDSLHIPFTYKVEEELKSGFKIEIKGKVKLLPVSFRINLQSGEEVGSYSSWTCFDLSLCLLYRKLTCSKSGSTLSVKSQPFPRDECHSTTTSATHIFPNFVRNRSDPILPYHLRSNFGN